MFAVVSVHKFHEYNIGLGRVWELCIIKLVLTKI